MKEITLLLSICAASAFIMGKKLDIPELRSSMKRPNTDTCEFQVYQKYFTAYAHSQNQPAKAMNLINQIEAQKKYCPMDSVIDSRLRELKSSLL